LWQGGLLAAGLGAVVVLGSLLASFTGMEFYIALAIAFTAAGILLRITRPFRQVFLLAAYGAMTRSGIAGLVDLGVWGLLRNAYQFWPGQDVDFAGLEALHRIHDSLGPGRRARILILVQLLSIVPHAPLARQAQDFLDAVRNSAQPLGKPVASSPRSP
jgi:hypothetical protein